jgi:hypothetical protein
MGAKYISKLMLVPSELQPEGPFSRCLTILWDKGGRCVIAEFAILWSALCLMMLCELFFLVQALWRGTTVSLFVLGLVFTYFCRWLLERQFVDEFGELILAYCGGRIETTYVEKTEGGGNTDFSVEFSLNEIKIVSSEVYNIVRQPEPLWHWRIVGRISRLPPRVFSELFNAALVKLSN